MVSEASQIVIQSLLGLFGAGSPQVRERLHRPPNLPRQYSASADSCKRPIRLRQDAVSWHPRRQLPASLAVQHRRADAEPASKVDRSPELAKVA